MNQRGTAISLRGPGVRVVPADDLEWPEHTIEWVVWRHILWVLDACGGNRTRAARVLGIARTSLLRKLRIGPPCALYRAK